MKNTANFWNFEESHKNSKIEAEDKNKDSVSKRLLRIFWFTMFSFKKSDWRWFFHFKFDLIKQSFYIAYQFCCIRHTLSWNIHLCELLFVFCKKRINSCCYLLRKKKTRNILRYMLICNTFWHSCWIRQLCSFSAELRKVVRRCLEDFLKEKGQITRLPKHVTTPKLKKKFF